MCVLRGTSFRILSFLAVGPRGLTAALDALWGMYRWLDRAPKGRNETGPWWRRHDEYDKHSAAA